MEPLRPRFPISAYLTLFLLSPNFRFARIATFSGVVLAIVFAMAFYVNSTDRTNESENVEHVADSRLDSFQRVLEEGNAEEIVEFLKLSQDKVTSLNTLSALPIRIENLTKQIQLAERLTEIGSEPGHEEFAILTTIDSRIALLKIYQENKLDTSEELRALEAFIVGLAESKNLALRESAILAGVFAKMERFRLDEIEAENIDSIIANVAERDLDNADLANRLVKTIDYFSLLQVDVGEFLYKICNVYADSVDPQVQELIGELELAFYRRNYNLYSLTTGEIEFIESNILERVEVVETLLERISKSSKLVTENQYQIWIQSLTMLMQIAPKNMVTDILARSNQALEQAETDGFDTQQMLKLLTINQAMEKPFPVETILDKDGNSYSLKDNVNNAILLVFVEPNGIDKPLPRLRSFSIGFDKLIQEDQLGLVVVYLGEKTDGEWAELQQWNQKYPAADLMNVSIDDNRNLFDNFPAVWSPMWMILDRERKLKEFNPLYSVMRTRLHQYVR